MRKKFSVILPALNEAKIIKACIDSIRKNESEEWAVEIIVVDNGSDDGTVEIAKEHADITIENNTENRKSISELRNLGAEKSTGDILAFLDADMVVPENWLETADSYFRVGYEGALGFVEKVPESAGWVGKTWGSRFILKRGKKMDVDFLPGRNIMINRSVFDLTGGFDTNIKTSEDKEFTFRVIKKGFRVMSIPDINLLHLGYEKDLREFLRKEFWRQGNTIKFAAIDNYSFRSMKNPMVSLWHIIFCLVFFIAIFFHIPKIAFFSFFLWIIPSAMIVFFTIERNNPFKLIFLFYILTFLRWNVAGVAIFYQLLKK